MAVGSLAAELIQLGHHEFRRLDRGHAVEVGHLVEGALERALRRSAVVADDEVDQRVVEHAHLLERIDQPADVMVGVLHERGIHLHLALQRRLELGIHVIPGRDLLVARRQHGIGGNDAQFLLLVEGDLALLVPAVGELALVLLDPLLRHVMRRMRGARREVHEERLVRQQRLLLARPGDGLVGQVFGQVIAFRRRLGRLDRRRAFIQRRVPLVVLAADEAVEILEAAAAGRPGIERPRRARLPDRHLVALAELRRRIAIELEGQRERRLGVGQDRDCSRARRSRFR